MINRVVGLYFSPSGGTARITEQIATEVARSLQDKCTHGNTVQCAVYNIDDASESMLQFDEDTVVVIGMPVRIGKLPMPALHRISALSGGGAMTVGVVAYGAMTYGNALYELYHYAEGQGFRVVGAGAFVARHGGAAREQLVRPDLQDLEHIRDFSTALSGKLARLGGCEIDELRIKPAPIYIEGTLPIHRISKISPAAAKMAERAFEKVTLIRREPEWYL